MRRFRFVVSGLLAGFVAGAFVATAQRGAMHAWARTVSPIENERVRANATAPSPSPIVKTDDAVSALLSANTEKDPLRRAFEMTAILRRLGLAEVKALTLKVLDLPDDKREELLEPLLERWNEFDSDGLAQWMQPCIARAFAARAVRGDEVLALAWARVAPERAIAAALLRPDSVSSEQLIGEATAALGAANPRGQIERMAALPPGALREHGLSAALCKWAEVEPAAAIRELDRVLTGRAHDDTQRQIFRLWARKEPVAALDKLRELLPKLPMELIGNRLVNEVVAEAASAQPVAALTWTLALPDGIRAPATGAALGIWVNKDAIAALEWGRANGLPLDETSQSQEVTFMWNAPITRAMQADNEKVAAWLRALPMGEERARLIRASLISASPNIVREFFAELSAAEQASIASSTAWQIARSDPEDALQWAQTLAPGAARVTALASAAREYQSRLPSKMDAMVNGLNGMDRDAVLRGYAQTVMYQDTAKGLEVAARITDPAIRERTFQRAATSWLSRDEGAARAWLSATPEISAASKEAILERFVESRKFNSF